MEKTQISLCLQDATGVIHRPFMQVNAEEQMVPGLLEAIGRLGKYIPVRSLIGEQVVTGLEYRRGGHVSILGQKVQWQKRGGP